MKYFASQDSEVLIQYLQKRSDGWFQNMQANGHLDRIKRSWKYYYGQYYNMSHDISLGGEQGELSNIAVNHYRSLARNILVMVTSTRPAFQARSTNTDRKSQIQTKLAQGLLDYYMREKKLERYLKEAVECAIILSAGYIKMEWDATKGRIYDYIKAIPQFKEDVQLAMDNNGDYVINEMGEYLDIFGNYVSPIKNSDGDLLDREGNIISDYPVYEGDVVFKCLTPYDICFDSYKSSYEDHDWVLTRTWVNKYDLAEKYPEMSEKIKAVETKSDKSRYRVNMVFSTDVSDDVPVYEFFHKRTESMPNGRYTIYLDHNITLMDEIMPYDDLPVYRITPSSILGSPYGYTDLFDILPIQDAINAMYSTVLTNNATFGVQSIMSPQGSNIKINQIAEGLNHIEYMVVPQSPSGGKPEALQLTKSSPEIYNLIGMLKTEQETLTGVNAVARGNATQNNLRSGNALALVQAQALQYMSGLQQSYIQLIEDVGTGLVRLLKKYAATPRVAAISGLNNITEIKEFTGEDLSTIERVVVDVGNALMSTAAGRTEVADNLVKQGLIKSPEKYLQVLNTGNLDVLTESEVDVLLQIRAENEALIKGEEIFAIFTDRHNLHIREHAAVLDNPVMRKNPELIAAVEKHMFEHIELLRQTDPSLLQLMGEQPLPPLNASPISQDTAQQQVPNVPNDMLEGQQADLMSNPQAQSVAVSDQLQNLPEPARPAGEDILGAQPTNPNELLLKNLK